MSTRGWRGYRALLIVTTVMIVLVFGEPTLHRVTGGPWRRGRFTYVDTLSLDVHAVLGYVFLLCVLTQVWLGFRQVRRRVPSRVHMRLGPWLALAIIPLFIGSAAWVVLDRSTTISPELSVIFKAHRPMARAALAELLLFSSVFVARAVVAIRRGDVETHVDSIVGAYTVTSGVVLIRFLYFLFWTIRGGSPLSVMGMFFLTMVVVLGVLILAYRHAGRLRANRVPLIALGVVTVLLAVLGAPYYAMMDV